MERDRKREVLLMLFKKMEDLRDWTEGAEENRWYAGSEIDMEEVESARRHVETMEAEILKNITPPELEFWQHQRRVIKNGELAVAKLRWLKKQKVGLGGEYEAAVLASRRYKLWIGDILEAVLIGAGLEKLGTTEAELQKFYKSARSLNMRRLRERLFLLVNLGDEDEEVERIARELKAEIESAMADITIVDLDKKAKPVGFVVVFLLQYK